jgi:hypothetical protein
LGAAVRGVKGMRRCAPDTLECGIAYQHLP